LLERLFEYQPAAARPRLIQALLVMAEADVADEEQLALYERVLELAPAQPEAVGGLRQIWRRRGDVARELGDLDSALVAYRMAGAAEKASEVEDQIQRQTLLAEIQAVEDAEGRGAYAQALELIHELADRYPERRDWALDVERLERKTELKDLYQRGLGALQSGDHETAQMLLAQVVALEPAYEEATWYLHRAVTGVDASSLRAAGQPRLDSLSVGLLSALTLLIWTLAGVIGGYFWGKASLGDEFAVALAAGAVAALTSGLVLALAWHWREAQRGLLAVGLVIGWGLMGAVVWGAGELLVGWRGPYVGAVVMGIASESVIFWRQRRTRPARAKEQPAKVGAEGRRRFSAWNPVDHLRLLWWVSVKPQILKNIIADDGQDAVRNVGKWLVSTLIWLPLLVACLVVWSSYNFELEEVLITAIGVLVAWLLAGWLGARSARWETWLAGAVGLGVAGVATVVLADSVWTRLIGWVAAAPVMVPNLAFLLTLGMVSGVALVLVKGVASGTAFGALLGVTAGLLFAGLGGDLDLGWVVLCLTGGALGLALSYLVVRFAGQGLRKGRPSWPARMLFPLLVLSYAVFVWLAVFDGWKYFD
jgi:tetratricopeptide (TPR) repeat protein